MESKETSQYIPAKSDRPGGRTMGAQGGRLTGVEVAVEGSRCAGEREEAAAAA